MQKEIDRYRFMPDKKRRLLSRVIIRQYLQDHAYPSDLRDWSIDKHKKPYLPQAPPFNISHSGDLVLVAFAEHLIGIDIEIEGAVDMDAIVHFFHPEEIAYFKSSNHSPAAFFHIWVRKEAFLKAVGVGLLQGLDTVNVLPDVIDFDERRWLIQKIDQWPGYQSALCMPYTKEKVQWEIKAS